MTNPDLNELERKIKAAALQTIRIVGNRMPESSTSWIVFGSISDHNAGVDRVIYDNKNKHWSHIEYSVYDGDLFHTKTKTISLQ